MSRPGLLHEGNLRPAERAAKRRRSWILLARLRRRPAVVALSRLIEAAADVVRAATRIVTAGKVFNVVY
jgi:hypothetical protein